jgi:predicted PurR-regulated permease PerM
LKLSENVKKIIVKLAAFGILIFLGYFIIKNREAVVSVLAPFFIAFVIAYLVNPVVVFLEKRGLKRIVAVGLIYSIIMGIFAGVASYVLPAAYRELLRLIDILPFYTFKAKSYLDSLYLRFSRNLTPEIKEVIRNNIDSIQAMIMKKITNTATIFVRTFESIVNWVIAFVISFYLVKDKDYFINLIKYIIPIKRRQDVYKVSGQINAVLTRFIRGQLVVALIVGVLATIGFLIIDLNFALLMGMVTGIANVIPYFGPIIGGVPVFVLGLLNSPAKALWAVIVVFAVQQLESGIITPKIVGDSVGIHPVFIIFSLFIAAKFFGVVGMLFAVPAAAILKVLVSYLFNKIVTGDGT